MTKHFDVGALCACGAVCKAKCNLLPVPLYCVNVVPLSCVTGLQSNIGTCSFLVRLLMILSSQRESPTTTTTATHHPHFPI